MMEQTNGYQRAADPLWRETCARLGISLSTLHKEIQAGRLRALKLGKKVLIPVEAEAEWLASLPPVNA